MAVGIADTIKARLFQKEQGNVLRASPSPTKKANRVAGVTLRRNQVLWRGSLQQRE